MKGVLVTVYHTLIWISFAIVLALSERDKLHAKVVLFLIFGYFCYVVAHYILQRRREALLFTLQNSALFLLIQQAIVWLHRL